VRDVADENHGVQTWLSRPRPRSSVPLVSSPVREIRGLLRPLEEALRKYEVSVQTQPIAVEGDWASEAHPSLISVAFSGDGLLRPAAGHDAHHSAPLPLQLQPWHGATPPCWVHAVAAAAPRSRPPIHIQAFRRHGAEASLRCRIVPLEALFSRLASKCYERRRPSRWRPSAAAGAVPRMPSLARPQY
jgi:hypothetical protein